MRRYADSFHDDPMIKAMSASDVADWLRERIRRGRFVAGQRLIEADITGETGASRSKVREALQRLQTENLVLIEEFRGASVRKMGIDEVRQIYRARTALEGIAAADCATLASAQTKSRLKELQRKLDECVANANPEQFGRLNREWHSVIIAGSNNSYVAEMLERLSIPIYRLVFETFYDAKRLKSANADHQKITEAIMNNDAASAEKLMRTHIGEGLNTLMQVEREFHSALSEGA
jgi:DNA-binding GntR family transcriptional regulator